MLIRGLYFENPSINSILGTLLVLGEILMDMVKSNCGCFKMFSTHAINLNMGVAKIIQCLLSHEIILQHLLFFNCSMRVGIFYSHTHDMWIKYPMFFWIKWALNPQVKQAYFMNPSPSSHHIGQKHFFWCYLHSILCNPVTSIWGFEPKFKVLFSGVISKPSSQFNKVTKPVLLLLVAKHEDQNLKQLGNGYCMNKTHPRSHTKSSVSVVSTPPSRPPSTSFTFSAVRGTWLNKYKR